MCEMCPFKGLKVIFKEESVVLSIQRGNILRKQLKAGQKLSFVSDLS